ncbi:MAG: DUF3703 domain-containing protein [Pseudoxanthomonas suwonensis]|nr:DUF3703 domain-containing protein [Pseudoxanthomonas suwonensis]
MRLADHQRRAFEAEMAMARTCNANGRADHAFHHLERAHVIGQRNVGAHVRAHVGMLRIGWQRRDGHEILGQLLRIPAALTKTLLWVPRGNTGGANVNAFRPMPIPADLQHLVD